MPLVGSCSVVLPIEFPAYFSDLSKSSLERAVLPRSVELKATHLGLVPRFTTWELTPYVRFPYLVPIVSFLVAVSAIFQPWTRTRRTHDATEGAH